MLFPGSTEPMTPEAWKVLGCLAVLGVALFLGVGLYLGVRTGFRNPEALLLLGSAILVGAMLGAAWYVLRRWVG